MLILDDAVSELIQTTTTTLIYLNNVCISDACPPLCSTRKYECVKERASERASEQASETEREREKERERERKRERECVCVL